jgi:hypothetical protein
MKPKNLELFKQFIITDVLSDVNMFYDAFDDVVITTPWINGMFEMRKYHAMITDVLDEEFNSLNNVIFHRFLTIMVDKYGLSTDDVKVLWVDVYNEISKMEEEFVKQYPR